MPDAPDPSPDAELLEPDPAPPPVLAKRSARREDDFDDEDDDRHAEYHPRGRNAKYDEYGYEITQNDMMWAIFTHAGIFFASFIAPLVILLVFAGKSSFITGHAKAALNQFLTVMLVVVIALLVGAAVGFGTYAAVQDPFVGIIAGELAYAVFALPLSIANIVFIVLGIVAAAKGQPFRCPYSIRFIG